MIRYIWTCRGATPRIFLNSERCQGGVGWDGVVNFERNDGIISLTHQPDAVDCDKVKCCYMVDKVQDSICLVKVPFGINLPDSSIF